jgi:hypothetical protein
MRTLSCLFVPLFLVGCGGPSLVGTWSGELDCGAEGDFEIEFTLEEHEGKDNTFDGDGEIKGIPICTNGEGSTVECDLAFEIEAESEGESGEQDLDIDLDDCEAVIDGSTTEGDCADVDDGEWDGADTITFEALDCEGEVEREG